MAAVRFPGPVCTAGAFLRPQRPRRRHKQRAAARPVLSQVAALGIPARAQLGLDYIWREGRAGRPAAPRAGRPALSGPAAGRAGAPGRACAMLPALNEVWGPRASHSECRGHRPTRVRPLRRAGAATALGLDVLPWWRWADWSLLS